MSVIGQRKFNYVEPANIKGDLSKQETCTIEKIKSYPDSRDVLLQKWFTWKFSFPDDFTTICTVNQSKSKYKELMHMSMEKKKKKKWRKHPQNLKKKIMMQCSLQVNDKQTAQRTGMDELAHELFLCAHRGWRPVVRSRSAGWHLEVLLLVDLPQPLDLLPQRLLMSWKKRKKKSLFSYEWCPLKHDEM